jgi:hypothetical protein
VKPFKLLYPNATFLMPPPAQWKFVDICTDQPVDVQQCLRVRISKQTRTSARRRSESVNEIETANGLVY